MPRWEQNPREPHALSAGKDFGLAPLERMRFAVRGISKNKCLDTIDDQNCQNVHARKLNESGSEEDAKQFPVIRIYRSGCENNTFLLEQSQMVLNLV